MTKKINQVGIICIATSLPKMIVTAADVAKLSGTDINIISKKLGFKQKRVARNNEHPSKFALNAAQKALKQANISPDDIGYIIYSGSGIFDYQFWSPSAYIQNKLKAKNAMAFEMNNGCNAAISAIHLAEKLLVNSKCKYALVVTSDTLSRFIDYRDSSSFPLFSMADGAAAVLLRKNHNHNRIIGYGSITDGQFVDCNKLGIGGTKYNLVGHDYIHVDYHHRSTKLLRNKSMIQNYVTVIKQSLKEAKINYRDISKLCMTQNSLSIVNSVTKTLGLIDDHLYSTREKFGHVGAIDSILAFDILSREGIIKDGENVILTSTGVGYHWSSIVIRV